MEIGHEVPIELRLSGIAQQGHQFPLHRQQIIEADEDIHPSCHEGLRALVAPMLNNGTLAHTGVPFLLRLHLLAQGLIQVVQLSPKQFVLMPNGVMGSRRSLRIDERTKPFLRLGIQLPTAQLMRGDRVRKEILHLGSRHRSVYIREIRHHLPAPVIKVIERQLFARIGLDGAVYLIEAHNGEQFVLGIEGTECVLQLRQGLYLRCPYGLCLTLLLQTQQFVLEHQTGTMRGQHQGRAAQLLPRDRLDDGAGCLLQETIHGLLPVCFVARTRGSLAQGCSPYDAVPPCSHALVGYICLPIDRTYSPARWLRGYRD